MSWLHSLRLPDGVKQIQISRWKISQRQLLIVLKIKDITGHDISKEEIEQNKSITERTSDKLPLVVNREIKTFVNPKVKLIFVFSSCNPYKN